MQHTMQQVVDKQPINIRLIITFSTRAGYIMKLSFSNFRSNYFIIAKGFDNDVLNFF
jgi:hypothetical protein